MKTFVINGNYNQDKPAPLSWYFLADSSLTNAGKPFFIPDFADEFEAIPVIAVRINRLGKSISGKYAARYYPEFAPAVHFRAKDLMSRLYSLHMPTDMACSFDRSFIMGDYIPFPEDKHITVQLLRNGEKVSEFDTCNLSSNIDRVVAEVSKANTLKMGDIIVPGLAEGTQVTIGDSLEITADGITSLSVQIK